jgi:hypothetical protein
VQLVGRGDADEIVSTARRNRPRISARTDNTGCSLLSPFGDHSNIVRQWRPMCDSCLTFARESFSLAHSYTPAYSHARILPPHTPTSLTRSLSLSLSLSLNRSVGRSLLVVPLIKRSARPRRIIKRRAGQMAIVVEYYCLVGNRDINPRSSSIHAVEKKVPVQPKGASPYFDKFMYVAAEAERLRLSLRARVIELRARVYLFICVTSSL